MIHFLLTRDHSYTLELYLQTWGRDMREVVAPPLCYERLAFAPKLNPGVYIFSDLERLTPAQTALAIEVHRQLAQRPSAFKLLNDPAKVLRRHDLLRALHAQGLNRFSARKIDDTTTTLKFPVFLRNDSDHNGAISPLLNNAAEVDRAVADAIAQGQDRDQLLLVEFLDVQAPDGFYRKYSYFRVGDRLIPRHLCHSRNWVVKNIDVVETAFVGEEAAFLEANPHADEIRKIFDIAHVDYGRIDYAVVDSQIQTFEINTNPTILVVPGRVAKARLQSQGIFCDQMAEAFKALEPHAPTESAHQTQIPRDLARRLSIPFTDRALRPVARAIRWLSNRPFVKRLTA